MNLGKASMQLGHHVAQKSTTTTLPRCFRTSCFNPSYLTCVMTIFFSCAWPAAAHRTTRIVIETMIRILVMNESLRRCNDCTLCHLNAAPCESPRDDAASAEPNLPEFGGGNPQFRVTPPRKKGDACGEKPSPGGAAPRVPPPPPFGWKTEPL